MKFYFDGGCKPNPGKMECAVVSENGKIKQHEFLPYGTNNEAEWIGLLLALELAKPYANGPVEIVGDSDLVIKQASGIWKVKHPSMAAYKQEFDILSKGFVNLKLTHVLRHKNPAGHYIEEIHA